MMETITQLLFLFLLFLMGLNFLGLFRRSLDILTIGFLSFPAGAALWVILSLIIIMLEIPFNLLVMSSLCLLWLLVAGFIIYLKKEFSKPDIKILTIITVVFWIVAVLALVNRYGIATADSWGFLNMSRSFTWHAGLALDNMCFSAYGVFIGLLHTGAVFFKFDYVSAYMPLLNFWFLISFGWLLYKALRYCLLSKFWAGLLSILAILIFTSTYFIIFQTFYIHTNMTAGVYFTLAVIALWHYFQDSNGAWLVLTTLFLIAFTLCRVEAPFVALLVLVPLVSAKDISYKYAIRCTGIFMFVILSWNLKLLSVLGFGDKDIVTSVLTSNKILSVFIGLAVFFIFVVVSKYPMMANINSKLPLIVLYVLVLIAVVFSFTGFFFGHIDVSGFFLGHWLITAQRTFRTIMQNMFIYGYWEATWWLIFILTLISFCLKPFKNEILFVTIVLGYFLFLYNIIFYADPFSGMPNWHNSSNRMLTHIFPVTIFYLFLKFGHNFPFKHLED